MVARIESARLVGEFAPQQIRLGTMRRCTSDLFHPSVQSTFRLHQEGFVQSFRAARVWKREDRSALPVRRIGGNRLSVLPCFISPTVATSSRAVGRTAPRPARTPREDRRHYLRAPQYARRL